MKKIFESINRFSKRAINTLILILAFLLTVFVIFVGAFTPYASTINIGDIAPKRYVATRSIENKIETERLRKLAENSVGELYKHNPDVAVGAELEIDDIFKTIDEGINSMKLYAQEEAARQNTLNKIGANLDDYQVVSPKYDYSLSLTFGAPLYFTSSQYELYDKLSANDKTEFISDIKYAVNYAFEQGITTDTRQNIISQIKDMINALKWGETLKSMAYSICDSVIVPNLIIDNDAVIAAKAQKASEIEPVIIVKDQKIIDSGEVITAETYAILTELKLINTGYNESVVHVLGSVIIIALCFVSAFVYLYTLQKKIFEKNSSAVLLFFIYALSLAIMFCTERFENFALVPLGVFAMLTSVLIKPKIAVVLNSFVCVIGSIIFNGDIYCLIYFIITGSLSAVLVQYTQKRTMVVIVAVSTGILNALTYFGIATFVYGYSQQIVKDSLFACATGVVSLVMVIGSLPLWEGIFGMNTKFTLTELANPNNELMRRLIIQTPGTYHHCLVVSNLAETAAYEIYANETLAKVGGLFHDIGKLSSPQYFSENQFGVNIHDKLDPYISAQVIIKHVKDGIDIANKEKLPNVLKDIIQQHHGTTLVKYFYVKSAKQKENTDEVVHEKDYRYPGPIPQSKEAAIVMLADTVEAAVRSYVSTGKDANEIEALVDALFKDKLNDGQLNDCRLDLKEIETIKKSFLKMLSGMYHHRVSYPKEEEIQATREKEAILEKKEEKGQ